MSLLAQSVHRLKRNVHFAANHSNLLEEYTYHDFFLNKCNTTLYPQFKCEFFFSIETTRRLQRKITKEERKEKGAKKNEENREQELN